MSRVPRKRPPVTHRARLFSGEETRNTSHLCEEATQRASDCGGQVNLSLPRCHLARPGAVVAAYTRPAVRLTPSFASVSMVCTL